MTTVTATPTMGTATTTARAAGSTIRDRPVAPGRRRHVGAPCPPDRLHPRRGAAAVPHGLVDREHVCRPAVEGERRHAAHVCGAICRAPGVNPPGRHARTGRHAPPPPAPPA